MDLATLVFRSDTAELEKASQTVEKLAVSMEKLASSEKSRAKTENDLAKATSSRAKAEESAASATEKQVAATEKNTKAVKSNVDILQRQKDILEFQAEGFSRADSRILAMAKSSGQLSKELKDVLEVQRQFSADPFDQSDLSIKRIKRSLHEAAEAQKLFADGTNLTVKQARELIRDQDRLATQLSLQKKSYEEITNAQKQYVKQYVDEANALNRIASSEQAMVKQRKEIVSATNYVVEADRKLAAALNTTNAGLDKAATDSLVKYETALRKSGMSQDLATKKLATYKVQLAQVQEQEQKVREQHLARALSPQISDVAVSLYSGQAPLTVLMQQGAQVADLMRLSGVEAQNFDKAMKDAFTSMIPVMTTVVKGVGQLVVMAFYDAGKAITSFAGNLTGINKVVSDTVDLLYLMGGNWIKVAKGIEMLGVAASIAASTGILLLVTALASAAVGLKQVIDENNSLAKSFALSGASMGLAHTEVIGYVKALSAAGATTGQATEALNAMAKEGKFTSSEIMLVGKSAIEMSKFFDIAIEDTVKQFAKLKEKPTEALLEIAKSSGRVTPEILKMVIELENSGKKADAASLAMDAYAKTTSQAIGQMKENYNGFSLFIITLGSTIKKFFSDTFKTLFLATDPATEMQNKLGMLRDQLSKRQGVASAAETDAIKVQIKAMEDQIAKTSGLAQEQARQQQQNVENAKRLDFFNQMEIKSFSDVEKKQRELLQLRNEIAAKGKLNAQEQVIANRAIAKAEKDLADAMKPKKEKQDPQEKYYENLMRSITKSSIEASDAQDRLTASQQKMIELSKDSKFLALSDTRKSEVMAILAANAAQEELNITDELRNKLLGQAAMLGKDYYKTLEQIQVRADKGSLGADEAEAMRKALQDSTPFAKAMVEYSQKLSEFVNKSKEDYKQSSGELQIQNNDLDYRLSLLGQTEEDQRKITIEYEKQKKAAQALLVYEKAIADIDRNQDADLNAKAAAKALQLDLYQQRLNQINKEAAVLYAEDFYKEFNRISDGITDSIVTALFEGGKAGSKKLRDLIVNELKKPVTLVVQAAVNILLGSLMGSLGLGSLASSALGGIGGNLLGSAASGAAGSMFGNFMGAGSFTGMLGNIGAGISTGFSTLFSQGISAWVSQGTGLLAAGSTGGGLGALLGPIGILGGALAVLAKGLSRTLKDTGIQGTFGGESGFQGESYKFYKGGFLRSDKTTTEALDKATLKALQDSFKTMRDQTTEFAEALGLDTSKIKDFTSTIKISLWKLKPEEIQAKLQEALATANNELAQQLIGTWETTTEEVTRNIQSSFMETENGADAVRQVTETVTQTRYVASEYAKEGEQAIDTLKRLAISITSVNATFANLGYALYDVGLAGANAASLLIEAFGGLEQFAQSTSYFYENFYSDAERATNLERELSDVFTKYGVKLPKTKEDFRALLASIDKTTEEGRKKFAELMKLSPMFVQWLEAQEAAIGASADLANAELDRIEETLRAQIDAQREILQVQADAVKEQVDLFQRLFDLLDSEIKKLYGSVTSTAKMQVADARSLITQSVSTGKLPDYDTLQEAIGTVTGAFGTTNYATKVEADKDRLKFAAQLDSLRDVAGDNLKSAKNSFEILKLQLDTLDTLSKLSKEQLRALVEMNGGIVDLQVILQNLPVSLSSALANNSNNSSTGNRTPQTGGTGGGASSGGNIRGSIPRVSYGSEEAVGSFDKFKDWKKGLESNATFAAGYKTPDWFRMSGIFGGTGDEDLFKQYTFFKNNPQFAADYERIMSGSLSQYSTSGATLAKSDLSKMPTDVADYFRQNTSSLLAYEGFGFDPVLAHKLYTEGFSAFGLDPRNTNITNWLRTHKWTENGIVENNNVLDYANTQTPGYRATRWDVNTGNIVDLDGSIYTPEGKFVGRASDSQMRELYGESFLREFENQGKLWQQNVGAGMTPEDYYKSLRTNTDALISQGKSAEELGQLAVKMGVTLRDFAAAYGITPDEVESNMRAAGATTIPAYKDGGIYSGGMAIVGEEGPELINFNRGGYVHTASQTRGILSNDDVVTALDRLNNKVELLEAAATQTALSSNKIAKILDRVTPDGNSLNVKTVQGSVVTTI